MSPAAERLRKLAEAATPGPWRVVLPGDLSWSERRKYRCVVLDKATGEDTSPLAPANARFIAALHPAVALALADLIVATERVEKRIVSDPDYRGPYREVGALTDALARVEEALR